MLLLFVCLNCRLHFSINPSFIEHNQFWKQFCTLTWDFLGHGRTNAYFLIEKVHGRIVPVEIYLSISLLNGLLFHQKLIVQWKLAIILLIITNISLLILCCTILLLIKIVKKGQTVNKFDSFDGIRPLIILREIQVG